MERVAAAVALYRGHGASLSIYLVHRAPQLRFFGDYLALPGGVRDAQDGDDDEDGDSTALQQCALRELFEETGVLLDGGIADAVDADERDAARTAMLGGDEAAAQDAWASLSARSSGGASLTEICRIKTPAFAPVRYDTVFFLAELPEGEAPDIRTGELIDGGFTTPERALEKWRKGDCMIVPPVLMLLGLLRGGDLPSFLRDAADVAAGFRRGKLHRVFFSPGILMVCIETPTLAPATTTNCLIVGTDRLFVIDPGAPDPAEQERLFELLDELEAEGAKVECVLSTHHHPDHVGAVLAVAQRYGVLTRGHALTLTRLKGLFPELVLGEPIADGDTIDLGTAPDGRAGWQLEAIFTPGHDRGHLAFRESRYGALIAGDMVSTVATIMIDPPEGHLATYMDSLERLSRVPMTTLYPAHGPAVPNGERLIRQFIEHRGQRQAGLETALGKGPNTVAGLLPQVYWDVQESLYPYASRSLLAGLEMLEEQGRAARDGDSWRLEA